MKTFVFHNKLRHSADPPGVHVEIVVPAKDQRAARRKLKKLLADGGPGSFDTDVDGVTMLVHLNPEVVDDLQVEEYS